MHLAQQLIMHTGMQQDSKHRKHLTRALAVLRSLKGTLLCWSCPQVKQLVPKSSVFGRNFPICQLLVQGVRVEVSSMHTRPHSSSSTRGHATGSGGVPPDAAQILQAGPKAAAAAAAAAAGGAQVSEDVEFDQHDHVSSPQLSFIKPVTGSSALVGILWLGPKHPV